VKDFLQQVIIAAISSYLLQKINNSVVIRECGSFTFCPFLSHGTKIIGSSNVWQV
jgi:hypothetical protein